MIVKCSMYITPKSYAQHISSVLQSFQVEDVKSSFFEYFRMLEISSDVFVLYFYYVCNIENAKATFFSCVIERKI